MEEQPRVTFRHVILAMRHHRVPSTPGQDMFLGAIVIILLPLLLVGFFAGLASTAVLGTFLWAEIALWSLLIGPPAALLIHFIWRFRTIARALKAEQAAGVPMPVQTRSDTAYFWVAGVYLLLIVPDVVIWLLVPTQDRGLVALSTALLGFIALLAVAPREHPRRLR